MAQRSEQAKLLTRSLVFQLLRDLAAFTIIFGFAAVMINSFIVPRIADFVADHSTEWEVYRYDSVSLPEALEVLQGDIFAVAQSWEEAQFIFDDSENGVLYDKVELDSSRNVVIEGSIDEVQELSRFENADEYSDAVVHIIRSNTYALFRAFSPEEVEAIPLNTPYVLFGKLGESPYWCSPIDICKHAVMERYVYSIDYGRTQVIYQDDSLAMRDISFYLAIKQLKYPLALIVYLVGFVIILVVGFRRALQYFDELSSAVGSVLTNRDRPLQLSKPLKTTQNELNAIRLAALSDEHAAQAAERRKDELVAYLAHDVKTPITSVIGYLSLLDEAPDIPDEQRQRYIKTALGKSERLEELIDEFFEITRYNLQAIPIERAQVEIRLFCQQVAEEFYPDAEAHDLSLVVNAPNEEQFFVDPDKFARALGNIVRNAITHANPGTEVTIDVEKTDEPIARWKIAVTDEGREISPAHLESIFDKFYRATSARSTSDGRAGLGLAIAKEIVVAHGGSIEAKSQEGRTTFTIYLPV